MSGQQRKVILVLTESQISFRATRDVLRALKRHGLKPMPARGRWMLDRSRHHQDRVADIVAVLELHGYDVALEGVLPVQERVARIATVPSAAPDQEWLW